MADHDQPRPTAERICIIAETRLYREGLRQLLARYEGMEVVATAGDPEEALVCIKEAHPDIVLLDMGQLEHVFTVRAILAADPRAKVVALSVPEVEGHVLACAEAGVSGYVPRQASADDLIGTLHSVARGELPCSPRIAGSLLRRLSSLSAAGGSSAGDQTLTVREEQIVGLIEKGLSNKEIATELGIELSTVKNHVHAILRKMHVERRGEAAAQIRRRHFARRARLDADRS